MPRVNDVEYFVVGGVESYTYKIQTNLSLN